MDIDAEIDAALPAPEAQAQTEIKAETPEPEKVETEAVSDKPQDNGHSELPKQIINKLSKQDRKIGKLTAINHGLKKELAELKAKAPKDAPKEADFEGKPYGEYLDARAEHSAEKKITERETQRIQSQIEANERAWREERGQALADNANEARKALPDFDTVLKQAQPVLDSLPPELADVLLEADNPAYAAYALVKEGLLNDFAEMSPTRAAIIVGRMEDRALNKPKPQTKAPAPLPASRGSVAAAKPLDEMSPEELIKWVKS